ncbi:MAG: SMC-Scp complex subunit ScpB, partial [Actinobacteria bacterium]|nr:SMC-Scp complex subunit ScpB [Actinomycetota bacterium]
MSEDPTQEQGDPIEVRPDLRAAIEAVLLAAVDSVEPQLLAQLLEI